MALWHMTRSRDKTVLALAARAGIPCENRAMKHVFSTAGTRCAAQVAIAVVASVTTQTPAFAQVVDRRFDTPVTAGLDLPATPLAGDFDARAVNANPAGLGLLYGPEAALAYTYGAQGPLAGYGAGMYLATPLGGGVLPRLGFGFGLEYLRPDRTTYQVDPGTPWRWSWALALPLGRAWALGMAGHHLVDTGNRDGVHSYDIGLTGRLGNRLALAAVVRDANRPQLGADVYAARRWELEATVRPTGTRRLALALGGRYQENRKAFDGWARAAVMVAPGWWLHVQGEAHANNELTTAGVDVTRATKMDARATLGLEIAFGHMGITAYATARRDADNHGFGASTTVVRFSGAAQPSVLGARDHIERIDIKGELDGVAWAQLAQRLTRMERDASLRGVVLVFDEPTGGWASFSELRDRIIALRHAGKKVFAYFVTASTRTYYAAAAADKVYLDPAGGVKLVGLALSAMYFKDGFDMLGIAPQFERIAEYKSAPEQFTQRSASEPAQLQRDAMLAETNAEVIAAIAASRKLSSNAVQELIDNGPYHAGVLAAAHPLIDAVALPEKVSDLVTAELGGAYPVTHPSPQAPATWQQPAIAVIHVEGEIVDGESMEIPILGRKLVGATTVRAAIAKARADARVAAIVLRINSPGGSAVASELMWRDLVEAGKEKPLICSMGDVAASGGYYIAAACAKIFAAPTTITGSIGIFYGKFDISGLLGKIGVNIETVTAGRRADMESLYRAFTEDERRAVQNQIRYGYERFTKAVAAGRGLSIEAVDAVGRGHVWTGTAAKQHKLVDEIGGLTEAVAYAAKTARVAYADVQWLHSPAPQGGLVRSLLGLTAQGNTAAQAWQATSALFGPWLQWLPASWLVAPTSLQARLPYQLQVP